MIRYVIPVLAAMVWLFALIEAFLTMKPRLMPRWAWVLITGFVPVVGSVLWFLAGRPTQARRQNRPLAPDDDPDFFASR